MTVDEGFNPNRKPSGSDRSTTELRPAMDKSKDGDIESEKIESATEPSTSILPLKSQNAHSSIATQLNGLSEPENKVFEENEIHGDDTSEPLIDQDGIAQTRDRGESFDIKTTGTTNFKFLPSQPDFDALSLKERDYKKNQVIVDGNVSGKADDKSTQKKDDFSWEDISLVRIQKQALGYISRGLPLPPELRRSLLDAVNSASSDFSSSQNNEDDYKPGLLLQSARKSISEFGRLSAEKLRQRKEDGHQKCMVERMKSLEAIVAGNYPSQLKLRAAIEMKSLKLLDLQKKVRFEVSGEKKLLDLCDNPKQLFDWSLLRPQRHDVLTSLSRWDISGMATNHVTMDLDMKQRKKRDAERKLLEETQEKQRLASGRTRFQNDLLNTVREFGIQGIAVAKKRKQRNDGVISWHVKQKQRASRAERLRVQALKTGDQEAYLQLVEESKNERLKTFLSKTNQLLQELGSMVQLQKDLVDKFDADVPTIKSKDSDIGLGDSAVDGGTKPSDLLEGQRRYNSVAHAISESVTTQPDTLRGGQLRDYQIEGLQWMLSLFNNNLNGILADEMGLGKTIQTIALVAHLAENKGVTGPHLILAPKAVIPNWAHEFATWLPSMTAVVYDGKQEDRKVIREKYAKDNFNVMITHYDLIMRDKAFLKKIKWHYLVVDEGHRLKNHESVLAKTLVSGYIIRRRLLLTGTPIQNNLSELWSLLNFLLPAVFNSSGNFDDWFNAPFADKSEVSLTEEEELLVIRRLHEVIRPFLLRRKKNEVEKFLPQKKQVIIKCDLSAWQRAYYSQIIDEGRVGMGVKGQSRSLQNTAMQLRKCCNHPFLFLLDQGSWDNFDRIDMIRASGKFEVLDKMLPKLRECGHRVLLFSQMTSLMNILEDFLSYRGFKYLRLDGNTKTDERGSLLKEFNAPDSPYFMFLLSTRAGGLGLNLQSADTVIIFDSDWNPQMDQQAEDRAHRIGQKKEVRVFILVSVGSIEEEILERAKTKMGIDAKVIQAGLFNTTSTATERKALLEEIMKKGSSRHVGDMPSEEEVNRLLARNEGEFRLFEKMDTERRAAMHSLYGGKAPLMTDDELPDFVVSEVDRRAKDAEMAAAGDDGLPDASGILSGKRKRNQIVNMDAFSDSQWQMLDEGADVVDVVKMGHEKRKRKRSQDAADDDSVREEEEEEEGMADGVEEGNDNEDYGGQGMKLKIKLGGRRKRAREDFSEGAEEDMEDKPVKRQRGRAATKAAMVEEEEEDGFVGLPVMTKKRSSAKRLKRVFGSTVMKANDESSAEKGQGNAENDGDSVQGSEGGAL